MYSRATFGGAYFNPTYEKPFSKSEGISVQIELSDTNSSNFTVGETIYEGTAIIICLQAPGGNGGDGTASRAFPTGAVGGGGGGAGGFVAIFADLTATGKITISSNDDGTRYYIGSESYTEYTIEVGAGSDGSDGSISNSMTDTDSISGGEGGTATSLGYGNSCFRVVGSITGGNGGNGGIHTTTSKQDHNVSIESGQSTSGSGNVFEIPECTLVPMSAYVLDDPGDNIDDEYGLSTCGGNGAYSNYSSYYAPNQGLGGDGKKGTSQLNGNNGKLYGSGGGGGGARGKYVTFGMGESTWTGTGGTGGRGYLCVYTAAEL